MVRAPKLEVCLLGSYVAAPQLQAAEGSSRTRSRRRQDIPEKIKLARRNKLLKMEKDFAESMEGHCTNINQIKEEIEMASEKAYPPHIAILQDTLGLEDLKEAYAPLTRSHPQLTQLQ
ncbi:unnamed protein product [Urochloa humidicola]